MKELAQKLTTLVAQENIIFYDGDCIFCQKYVEFFRIKEALGSVSLANLRNYPDVVTLLREYELEPNEGMVFVNKDQVYWGDEAVNVLAKLSEPSGLIDRLQNSLLSSYTISRVSYPLLKTIRAATLKLRGKDLIP